MAATRFFVSGKVQGVWFRAFTVGHAQSLGLTGYARNLPDGRVEVLAMGEAVAIDALARFLHEGPPRARVDRVDRQPAVAEPANGFAAI